MADKNHFFFDDIDIVELLQRHNSPFFLISENKIRENYQRFARAFSGIPDLKIYYSLKTNFESKVLKTLKNLNVGAELAGELDIVLAEKAGFPAENIVIDGPSKSDGAIEKALLRDFHIINSESLQELFQINKLAKKHNKVAKVGLRIDPLLKHFNINAFFERKHKKFGFIEEEMGFLLKELKNFNNIKIEGLLSHITAPLPAVKDYIITLKSLFNAADKLHKTGIEIKEINLGGGFYPLYFEAVKSQSLIRKILGIDNSSSVAIEKFGRAISESYLYESKRYGIKPVFSLEPGKAIVEDSSIIVGKIVDIFRGWALTDISTNDFDAARPVFKRPFVIANKINHAPAARINIGGPTLRPNDVLYRNVWAPQLEKGDSFCILNTGGYSISLANQFLRPRIAVFFKNSSGQIDLIRRQETPGDVIHTQIWQVIAKDNFV